MMIETRGVPFGCGDEVEVRDGTCRVLLQEISYLYMSRDRDILLSES